MTRTRIVPAVGNSTDDARSVVIEMRDDGSAWVGVYADMRMVGVEVAAEQVRELVQVLGGVA